MKAILEAFKLEREWKSIHITNEWKGSIAAMVTPLRRAADCE